ncbi:GL25402 [Drosophila persimilis]|uniref:GL25402 n=1 Tax=Drosophila persimilis TaxID=7234 RepID=B4IRV6_DROPE|nr:GL25402 [Drosophila persimilis]
MWQKLCPVGNGANLGRALAANKTVEQGSPEQIDWQSIAKYHHVSGSNHGSS